MARQCHVGSVSGRARSAMGRDAFARTTATAVRTSRGGRLRLRLRLGVEEAGEGVGEVGEGVAFDTMAVDSHGAGSDAERTETAGEPLECGIGNAGCGMGNHLTPAFECGIWNAECGMGNHLTPALECGRRKAKWLKF